MKKYLTSFLLLLSIAACDEDCEPANRCIVETLRENNMVPFRGQELECKFYLTLFHYKGEQYFLLNNNCADMVAYPFNCDGETLCEGGDPQACEDFFEDAEFIGIVGVRES